MLLHFATMVLVVLMSIMGFLSVHLGRNEVAEIHKRLMRLTLITVYPITVIALMFPMDAEPKQFLMLLIALVAIIVIAAHLGIAYSKHYEREN